MNDLHNVYDLFCPSPVALEKIATIKVAIELWRQEIRKHCANGTLNELNELNELKFEEITLSNVLNSYVPESILLTIEEYVKSIGLSIQQWIYCHTENHFFQLEILNDFNDFVGNFDGSIDFEKTAKKMILCDGISRVDKFKIACLYCFEDEITLLWPSVSTQIGLSEIEFCEYPHSVYWICHLKNQLYMIPDEKFCENVDRNLFNLFILLNAFDNEGAYIRVKYWSSIKYILDRVDSIERMSYVTRIFSYYPEKFYRYVLAKLNKCEFDELLTENRNVLWDYARLHYNSPLSRTHKVMSIWMYVKNELNEYDFAKLIQQTLSIKPITGNATNEPSVGCRIYATAPDNFKKSAEVTNALLNNYQFVSRHSVQFYLRDVSLLLMALSNASDHDRTAFLKKYWLEMMFVMNIDEFRQFLALCFKNEEEINHFRETHFSNYENIGPHLLRLFRRAEFEKLNELISNFCVEKSMRDIRLRLLNENFGLNEVLKEPRALNEFINDAFNDADRATEFKNQLLLKPSFVKMLGKNVKEGDQLQMLREFIDTVMSKQFVTDFKKKYISPSFRLRFLFDLSGVRCRYNYGYDVTFLRWCLENEDGNVDPNQAIPVDEIVQVVLRREMWRKCDKLLVSSNRNVRVPMTYYPDFVEFLKWYLVTSEAYENLVAKYANNDVFAKLTKPNDQDIQ